MLLGPLPCAAAVALIWTSLSFVRSQGTFSVTMPNAWNVSFDYYSALVLLLLLYLVACPFMFLHMWSQRKAKLGGGKGGGGRRGVTAAGDKKQD